MKNPVQVRILSKVFILLLITGSVGIYPASAAGGYSAAPRDLAKFQAQIQSSLVKISCTGFTTLGIAEKVATGVSNRIVAPSQSIINCPKVRNGSGISITNLNSNATVPGNLLQAGSGISADYAWLISKSDAKAKFLNDRKGPIPSGWLTVASYALNGVSINWNSSSIQSINLTDSTIVINNGDLNIPNGGLVFDAQGNFLGVVSSTNPGNSVTLMVSGSPLRCKNIDETKVYSEVCLSSESDAIIRSTLWPDNSVIARGNANSRGRAEPTPNPSDDPFGLKRDSNSANRPTPSSRPTSPSSPSSTTRGPSPKPSISASSKPTSVTCVKGRDVVSATGTPPTCPAGYRKK